MSTTVSRTQVPRKAKRPATNGCRRSRPTRCDVDPLALENDLLELARSVPAREWAGLPRDFNANLDHYLYGSPKKSVGRGRMA